MRRRRLVGLLALVVAMLAVVGIFLASQFNLGPADPAVRVLGESDAQALRDAFNAHPERTRVLALLSPT